MFILASRNSQEYENAINTVRFFHQNDMGGSQGEPTETQRMVTAINLLFLLSNNRTQEFYSQLESIPFQQLSQGHIAYVLLLNDAIEEGNYRKIFVLKDQNPLPAYFGPFLDRISETVRTEMAKSAEKAYRRLSISEALNIFQVASEKQLR